MMTCDEARRSLPAYVVGDLEEGRRPALAEHLAACEGCRREEARLAHVLAMLRGVPGVPPSALRKERALAAARTLPREDASLAPRRLRWIAAAAVLLLSVFALRNALRPSPPPFSATVEMTEGVVERLAGGTWAPVTAGEAMVAGDQFRTATGRMTLRSNRGDLFVLDVDSTIEVSPPAHAEEGVFLHSGQVWCEAAHRSGRRLVVGTPGGRVEVVGTKFNVRYR